MHLWTHYWPWAIPFGFLIFFQMVRLAFPRWWAKQEGRSVALANEPKKQWGWGILFIAIGLAFTTATMVLPIARSLRAQSWPTVIGKVMSSKLDEQLDGDNSRTYRINIRYAYSVAGHHYERNRYDATIGSSSLRAAKAAIVHRYHLGVPVTVF